LSDWLLNQANEPQMILQVWCWEARAEFKSTIQFLI
jgi:hypothetical protein